MLEDPLRADQNYISFDALVSQIEEVLLNAGASKKVAGILARNCASCERDGTRSHGVFRVQGYLRSLRSGWANGSVVPQVEIVTDSLIRIDAGNGFTQPAIASAQKEIDTALQESGIAVIAVREGHHFSALWPDLEPYARRGYVALGMIAGGKLAVTPQGARQRVFSTNPVGFATPVAGGLPLVFDFATSSMSHGDLQLYAKDGVRVPPGTGVDRHGNETDDANEILTEGGLLPFGGHKGALLSMMIEILAAGLTGGAFSYQINAEAPKWASTYRTGQLFIVMDPSRGDNGEYAQRVAEFVEMLRSAGLSRLPGDRRYEARQAADRDGIIVTDLIRELFNDSPH